MSSATALARVRVLSSSTSPRAEPRCITAMAQADPTAPTPMIPTFTPTPPAETCFTSRLARNEGLQQVQGRDEEEVTGQGAAEVQQTIVVTGRAAHEHVLQHLLDRARRARVADEVGGELPSGNIAEWHVVAENLGLFPVLDQDGQRVVRRAGLDGVVQLDVRQLGATDDPLLRLDGQGVPGGHVVDVLLHDDVTAAREAGVLVTDQGRVRRGLIRRVLGPVDEADQVANVEVLAAMSPLTRGTPCAAQ